MMTTAAELSSLGFWGGMGSQRKALVVVGRREKKNEE
jgi:hypothetical protein